MRTIFPRRPALLIVLIFFVALTGGALGQARLKVVSWKVESGDSDPQTLTQRVRAFQGVDLWGFSKVQGDAVAAALEAAAEHGENANFDRVLGTTRGGDRLLVVFNSGRFQKVAHFELSEINIEGRVRAPLVAHFREAPAGREFLFMVNHLYRRSPEGRHEQARLLNSWARAQTLPVVAVGDYNFGWSVTNGDNDHVLGYDRLTRGGVFAWARPQTLVRSQCSFDSVLDFVFTAGGASGWQGSSEILAVPGDCPDDAERSDHRPVQAVFTMQDAGSPPPLLLRAQILERLESLEAEVRRLNDLVN